MLWYTVTTDLAVFWLVFFFCLGFVLFSSNKQTKTFINHTDGLEEEEMTGSIMILSWSFLFFYKCVLVNITQEEGCEGGKRWEEGGKEGETEKRLFGFFCVFFFSLLTEATAILLFDSFCHQLAAKSANLHQTGNHPKFERLVNQDLALSCFSFLLISIFTLSPPLFVHSSSGRHCGRGKWTQPHHHHHHQPKLLPPR